MLRKLFACFFIIIAFAVDSKIPELSPKIVNIKMQEIMKAHAKYKKLTPEIMKRIFNNYLEELDPAKSYFINSDIQEWENLSDDRLTKIVGEYEKSNFKEFERIHDV